MKQASGKWKVGSKTKNKYETEMSTCENDFVGMCNSLFRKSEICFFKRAISIDVIFVKGGMWNVSSETEKKWILTRVAPAASCSFLFLDILMFCAYK